MKRHTAVLLTSICIALMGVLCTLSINDWSRFPLLKNIIVWAFGSATGSMFDLADILSSNYLLPLGGLGISVFVGWVWGTRFAIDEIRKGGNQVPDANFFAMLAGLKDDPSSQKKPHTLSTAMIFGIFIRFLTPIGIIIAFLHSIGWLSF